MPILIVEDDESTRICLSLYFKMMKRVCMTTDSIAGAIRIMEGIKPKTVLLDLMLDDGVSIPVINLVKSFEGKCPKLILMSAHHTAEKIANEYKIEHRLKKPFTLEALEKMVQ